MHIVFSQYPETVKYKDYIKIRNWKNHFLTIIYYIDKLKTDYQYDYKADLSSESPEIEYLAKGFPKGLFKNSKDAAFVIASKKGYLGIVKYLKENGANLVTYNNEGLRLAIVHGHLPVVKYLVEHGVDITSPRILRAVILAEEKGHLPVVEYLQSLQ